MTILRWLLLSLWRSFHCRHEHVRCTHGDEAMSRGVRRVCMDCGRGLKGDLPDLCAYTGESHNPPGFSRVG